MNLYGIKIRTFYLHFSTITRGGATEFSKRKDCTTAQSFDAWRARHAWLSHEEVSVCTSCTSLPGITRVKMATARSLCKVCRSFLSTNVILQSQSGQTSAKVNSAVGLEFGSCFINVF